MPLFFCIRENPVDPDNKINYPGMVRISSRSETVVLGSDGVSAQTDEKPVSSVKFTYDYHIDTSEVTIGFHRAIMGKIPKEYDTLTIVDTNHPVCYVSWYDAVLFCNQRSIRENLDTVYSYLTIEKTASEEIYRMVGLRTDFRKNGYRLPTEAEWIFAARGHGTSEYQWGNDADQDSAKRYTWYNGNSLLIPHGVAALAPNMHGLYDMSGNATEWVNDRKVLFNGSEITDFVGGVEDGTPIRVLKGGSFKLAMTNLRVACRSDLYPIDAASRNHYTGFRCVAGSIDKPTYLTKNSTVINLEPVSIVNSSLLPVIGTNNARLVFVNKSGLNSRTLCFLDYNRQPLDLYQFTDRTDVYTPTISPDGEWVSWATRDEGSMGEGAVYVRRLARDDSIPIILPDTPAFVPRWYVDAATADTFLLYVTSAQLNDHATWKSSQTRMMLFANGRFSGSPVIVESAGTYHGGRSADGNFIATGFPLLRMKNLQTQEEKTLFYAPYDGKTGSDTSQVCNVSISPEPATPDRVLFLDFGSGRDASTLTNTVYQSHEYIFMSDFSGRVLNWYQAPVSYTWNHVEWSNRTRYAVATATTAQGTNRLVYCINLQGALYTTLLEGTDLCHPYLWISPGNDTISTNLNLDSIGQYDNPHMSDPQALLAYKMRLFWQYASILEVVFVGSSIAADGIDPRVFTGVHAFNMAVGNADLATELALIDNYIINHCKYIKVIGMSFDPHFFFFKDGAATLFKTFTYSKGYVYDRRNLFWSEGIPPQFTSLINAVSLPQATTPLTLIDSLGLIRFYCDSWGAEPPPCIGDLKVTTDNELYRQNINRLLQTITVCTSRGIKVLLVNFPNHPGYAKTDAFGIFGPSRTTVQKIVVDIQAETARNPGLTFYDANQWGAHDYTEFEFVDNMHLCETGAQKLSARIDSILHRIID